MKCTATIVLLLCGVVDVLSIIRPGSQWAMTGDGYGGLIWLDKATIKPSLAEVEQAILTCNAQETVATAEKRQAILDAKSAQKTTAERLDALIKAIDLK